MTNFLRVLSFFAFFNVTLSNFLDSHRDSPVIERFRNWVEVHRIQVRDDRHFSHMFENWFSNDKFISETNTKNLTYTVGHNAYSGMNSDEFAEFMGFSANQYLLTKVSTSFRGSVRNVRSVSQPDVVDVSALPTSVDWRTKGVVNNVRDQGQCGSCWAFSGTSTVESAVAIKTGHLYDLSEQQAVSCAGLKYGNLGCNGGFYDGLWNWEKVNGGQCSEASYPYTSGTTQQTGSCVNTCTPVAGTKVSSFVAVTPQSDTALMTALTVEPVSIAIEADTRSFQLYSGGVYSDYTGCNKNSGTKGANSQPNIDHAVVLVGYGSQNGQDYYILRNSWGTSWGENGYQRIARGTQYGPYGMCGVLYQPEYPVV
jgi:C1A family cysteine protease